MHFKRLSLTTGMLLAVLLFSFCTKNVPGPQGDPGTPGKPGNLKKTEVAPFKVDAMAWTKNLTHWECTVPISQITAKVIDNGEVMIYRKVDNAWSALPYSGEQYIMTQAYLKGGSVQLMCTHIHGGEPSRPAEAWYRLVILSPP